VVDRPWMLCVIYLRNRMLRVVDIFLVHFTVVMVEVVMRQVVLFLWGMRRVMDMDTRRKCGFTRFFRVGVVRMVSMVRMSIHRVRNGVVGVDNNELVGRRLVMMDSLSQGLFVNHRRLGMLLSHPAVTKKIGHVCVVSGRKR